MAAPGALDPGDPDRLQLVAVLCSLPLYYQVTEGCFLLAS
jgi:hypothetical protein